MARLRCVCAFGGRKGACRPLASKSFQAGPRARTYKATRTASATADAESTRNNADNDTSREAGLVRKKSAQPEKSQIAKPDAGRIHDRTPNKVAAKAIVPLPKPTIPRLRGEKRRASTSSAEKTFSSA